MLERKNKKLQNNKDSILFNSICLNEKMLPKYTFFKNVCVCVRRHTRSSEDDFFYNVNYLPTLNISVFNCESIKLSPWFVNC